MWVRSLGGKYPLQEEIATHCSILALTIPWIEEPSRLQSMGSQRAGHDRSSLSHTYTYLCQPVNCFLAVL